MKEEIKQLNFNNVFSDLREIICSTYTLERSICADAMAFSSPLPLEGHAGDIELNITETQRLPVSEIIDRLPALLDECAGYIDQITEKLTTILVGEKATTKIKAIQDTEFSKPELLNMSASLSSPTLDGIKDLYRELNLSGDKVQEDKDINFSCLGEFLYSFPENLHQRTTDAICVIQEIATIIVVPFVSDQDPEEEECNSIQ